MIKLTHPWTKLFMPILPGTKDKQGVTFKNDIVY